jgi:hypothetical protein
MSLGKPPIRRGGQWQGPATDVPLELLQHLKLRPLPITVGGTSNRTFTLNASTTHPAVIWNGDDFIYLKSTVAYSFTTGTDSVLDSTGAETTQSAGTIGVYYMYLDATGENILPSTTGPDYVEYKYNTGALGHPGTSRAQNWTYVGFVICDATTPTFLSAVKTGFVYNIAPIGKTAISSFVAHSSWASAIPDLGKWGLTVSGDIAVTSTATAVVNQVTISGNSTGSSFGVIRAMGVGGNSSADITNYPYAGLTPADGGKIYSIASTTVNGTVYVSQITDVV